MAYSLKYEYIYFHPVTVALMVSAGASCICCYPMVFFYAVKHKTYHLNFKIIWNLIGICLSMFSFGFIIITIYDKSCGIGCSSIPVYIFFKNWVSYFHRTERCLLLGLLCERCFASILYEIYEKKQLLFVSIVICLISFLFGGLWFILSFINIINDMINVAIHIFALLLCLIGILLLYIFNKKNELVIERKLSARFTIKDNIRTVKLILGPLIISNITETVGCILLEISILFMQEYTILLSKLYYLTMALQPLSWLLHILKKNKAKNLIQPTKNNVNKQEKKEEGNHYFINLQKQWKV
ncbi:7TM GPCR, serpentine receptor class e (Sre) family-containing protein [Strongyloides ratti]|uniref:7TM GPCR, serpentine receptor class e (Sre) family-containing protein n=1 Tax=Strongyloides ratti TaxID=34506 RepID=A0A090LKW6_STRRB|nr:7TM GPCR, serpentine receptor class e (Sre) family-containing protein [Strongyloides ratti]CEF70353.1 7TM GPCR, serpentine receptor class e (Sre) family-containing protein [Strongyloides ratti]